MSDDTGENFSSLESDSGAQSHRKRDGFLSRLPFWSLVGLTFLLPVFFLPSPASHFQLTKVVLLAVFVVGALVMWIVGRLRTAEVTLPRVLFFYALLFLPIVSLLSAVWARSFSTALFGGGFETDTVAFLLLCALFTLVTAVSVRTREHAIKIYAALLASFFVVALFQMARLSFGFDTLAFSGTFTTSIANLIGKWNDLGIFFGLIAILTLTSLEFLTVRPLVRVLLSILLAFALFLLAVVNFLAVWTVLGALAIVFAVYRFSLRRGVRRAARASEGKSEAPRLADIRRELPIATLAVLVVASVFIFTGNMDDNRLGSAISSAFKVVHLEARPSWTSTLAVARQTLLAHPILGVGPNHFLAEWHRLKPEGINSTPFWAVDFSLGVGLLPTMLITTGLLGAAVLLTVLIGFCYHGFRALFVLREDPLGFYLLVSSFVGALYGWIILVIYVPSPPTVALTFLFTGLFLAVLVSEKMLGERTISFLSPRASLVGATILVSLGIVSLVGVGAYAKRALAMYYYQRATIVRAAGAGVEETDAPLTRARKIHAFTIIDRARAQLGLAALSELLAREEINTDAGREAFRATLGTTIDRARAAMERNEYEYQNWLVLGDVYTSIVPLKIEGAYGQAKDAYDRARALNPTHPAILLALARLEAARGENGSARDLVKDALNMKNNYSEAIFFLSQLDIAAGNLDEALKSVESASLLEPNNPLIFFQLGLLRYNGESWDNAIAAFERAVLLNDVYANARYFLGLSYARVGRTADALTQFEVVARYNPDNAEVKTVVANLRAGREPFAGADVKPPEEREELPIAEE
ncbi:MAG: tetratricopeptide repeat protein [bacterium]|nr:tetratricopeptide repeat protein [bacterium]MDZ4284660.1 tetratricopeptide repeat protein [Patescibacteria group bacterium]